MRTFHIACGRTVNSVAGSAIGFACWLPDIEVAEGWDAGAGIGVCPFSCSGDLTDARAAWRDSIKKVLDKQRTLHAEAN
jgi:hypothetical protein